MESAGSERLSRRTGDPRPKEKGENQVKNNSASQSKVGRWGGSQETEGDGKRSCKKFNCG